MRCIALAATFLTATACLGACGGDSGASRRGRTLSYGDHARAAYETAMADFRDENCLAAEPEFRTVRREYPYSRYAALAELRLADCMMMQSKFVEAIQAYRQFVRGRPSHREVPYARFKVAEAYFKQIPEDWLLAPPAYERDQGPTRDALEQLRRFILDFPDDRRRDRAQTMVRKALALLARHELYVAEFYLDRDRPRAAAARLHTLVTAYAGSGLEPKALLMLGHLHADLGERDLAREALEDLVARFPRSAEVSDARSALSDL